MTCYVRPVVAASDKYLTRQIARSKRKGRVLAQSHERLAGEEGRNESDV